MWRLVAGICLFLILNLPLRAEAQPHRRQSPPITMIDVAPEIALPNAKRLGINIGAPDQYGAAQFLKNLIVNPGFEAGEIGMIFHAAPGATADRIQADNWQTSWNNDDAGIGQPAAFWDGAAYEILYGAGAGQRGAIRQFTHEGGKPTFYLENPSASVANDDVIIVRRALPGFEGDRHQLNQADDNQRRPGSPGEQSLRLLPPDEAWQPSFEYHMDSYWRDGDPDAGKLLIIRGSYRLEFWAKAERANESIRVAFHREGQPPFFTESIPLTSRWQKISRNFYAPPGADPFGEPIEVNYLSSRDNQTVFRAISNETNPILELTFHLSPDGGSVWIDDAALYRLGQDNPTLFTDKFVRALKGLQPGILRNWGNQLGSSLDNQLASPFARKLTAHSPRERFAEDFHYSLPEFLALCAEVGAEPWYVIPPTFTSEELENLIAYLAAPEDSHPYAELRQSQGRLQPWTEQFPAIHLEYGNELWGGNAGNDPFIGATLRGGERLGEIGNDRLAIVRNSPYFDSDRFNLVLGGQYGEPLRQAQIQSHSNSHDSLALAPYFGVLHRYSSHEEIYLPHFARPREDVVAGNLFQYQQNLKNNDAETRLAIYEIGYHSTTGEASAPLRNDFVTGLNSGLALPLYMLTYQRDLGIRNQNAFTALQFSYRMENDEYVRLWGAMRDIEVTGAKRPAWLGLQLANRAIQGDMMVTRQYGHNPTWIQYPKNDVGVPIEILYVQSFAFREGDRHALLLFNLHLTDEQMTQINLPAAPHKAATTYTLTSEAINDDNESEAKNILIQSREIADFHRGYLLNLPAHSLTLVEYQFNRIYLPMTQQ